MGTRYLGFAEETTLGTWVAPTKYSEIRNETVIPNMKFIFPETSRARAATKKMAGNGLSSGELNFHCAPENLTPYVCKWNLGEPVSTLLETGVYEHVFKPKDTVKSASIELGVESMTRKLAGSLVDTLTIEGVVNNPLRITAGIFAKEETKGTIGTPSYSTVADFNWTDCQISIGGTLRKYVRALRCNINNNVPIDELFTLGYTGFQYIEVGQHIVDGSVELLFPDTVEYDRYLAATEFALQLKAEGVLAGTTKKYTFQLDLRKSVV